MPEEINRVLTDALSDFLFITEEDAMVNLVREGILQEKIFFVGNVMIDTLLFNLKKIEGRKVLPIQNEFNHHMRNGYVLVTLHRPSNVDIPEKLIPLMECLKKIALKIPIIFPVHPRTRLNLERFGILKALSKSNGILLTEPLGYLDFLCLLKSTTFVLTDSGGIQEEATFLRVPCITLRENTERPVTTDLGTNYLVGTNPEKILETVFTILDGRGKKGEVPPLWDGNAGRRIVEILIKKLITSHYGISPTLPLS
jgi:UDP-N-acetylglucosamine 2-epimerase (non-hydrolysing)